MMIRKQNYESAGVHSTLSSESVATKSSSEQPAGDRILCSGIRRNDEPPNEKALHQHSGLSKICPNSMENLKKKDAVEKAKSEAFSEKSSCEVPKERSDPCDFSEPKLLTSLKIIESLHSLSEKGISSRNQSSEDSNIPKKAAQKVNIPFEKKIYKDLINLQVNDVDLGLTNLPIKPKEIIRARDPEPVLSDYYKPKFNKEYVIKPTPPNFSMTSLSMPQVRSVYAATKRWEPQDN